MDLTPIIPVPPAGRKRRFWSRLGVLLGGPLTEQIAKSAVVIGDLTERIKEGPTAHGWVYADDERRFDLVAMALQAGVTVEAIRVQLANRGRQTARAVWCYLAGGVGFLVFWLVEAISTPACTRLSYVAGLLLICAAFFLSAFYNALVNWQLRTLRLGSAREFLCTNERWWPSW
jgi:hypothetical protein